MDPQLAQLQQTLLNAITEKAATLEAQLNSCASNLGMKIEQLTAKVNENSNELQAIKASITSLDSDVTRNKQNISQLEEDMTEVRTLIDNEQYFMHKMVRALDQKQWAKDIVMKGFPNENFDENEIQQNLAAICGFKQGFAGSYKFAINIAPDKRTKQPRKAHMMNVSLASINDKDKLFRRLKEQGNLTLGELTADCTEEQKQLPVWIDHRLTPENLDIKKRLLDLKREGLIESFVLRSGNFVVQAKNPREKITIFEMWQLEKMFPKPENSSSRVKRGRDDDSSSNENPSKR